jgi:hypothetical protein
MGEPVEPSSTALRLSKAAQWLQPCPDIQIGGTTAQLLGGEHRAEAATNRGCLHGFIGKIATAASLLSLHLMVFSSASVFSASCMHSGACAAYSAASLRGACATAAVNWLRYCQPPAVCCAYSIQRANYVLFYMQGMLRIPVPSSCAASAQSAHSSPAMHGCATWSSMCSMSQEMRCHQATATAYVETSCSSKHSLSRCVFCTRACDALMPAHVQTQFWRQVCILPPDALCYAWAALVLYM